MAAGRSLLLLGRGASFFITRFVGRAAALEEAAGCSLSVVCAQVCSKLQASTALVLQQFNGFFGYQYACGLSVVLAFSAFGAAAAETEDRGQS